jgi:hypothetical protein
VSGLAVELERLSTLAKRLEAECAESANARTTLEAMRREIETIRQKLKVLNLP